MTAPETPKIRPLSLALVRAVMAEDTVAMSLIVIDADTDSMADLALDLAGLLGQQVKAAELIEQIRKATKSP